MGNLKARSGKFTVLGLIYKKKGNFYLQDSINEIKVLLDLQEPVDQYVFNGAIILA